MVLYKSLENDEEVGLEVNGHAPNHGEHSGRNIVCAAISTVCDMVFRGCIHYASKFEISAESGIYRFTCERKTQTEAIVLAGIFELEKIKENYPDCFEKEGK